jgi:hypothetical protein
MVVIMSLVILTSLNSPSSSPSSISEYGPSALFFLYINFLGNIDVGFIESTPPSPSQTWPDKWSWMVSGALKAAL